MYFMKNRRSAAMTALLVVLLAAGVWAQQSPVTAYYQDMAQDPNALMLRVGEGDPLAGSIALPKNLSALPQRSASGADYFIMQFDGPLSEVDLKSFQAQGIEFLSYIPNNAYIVRNRSGMTKTQARAMAKTRWADELRPAYKLEPELAESAARRGSDPVEALIIVWEGESRKALIPELQKMGVEIIRVPRATAHELILARIPGDLLDDVAALGEVEWIEAAPRPTLRNDIVTWVVQSNVEDSRPLWDAGLHGEGQIIGHIDGVIDLDNCYIRDPEGDPPGPNHRKVIGMRGTGSEDNHGMHTAATAMGKNVSGSLDNAGHAYEAKVSHGSVDDIVGLGNDTASNQSDLAGLLGAARADGAYVHTNSWGEDGRTNYTYFAVAIDEFTWEHEDQMVAFAATNQNVLYTPENSKNVLAVGNTNKPPSQGTISTGGTGPTSDGRRKPDIFAPGTGVISAVVGSCSTSSLTGTSMACPAVVGTAALIRQYFTDGYYPTGQATTGNEFAPTGALLKAVLLNGTVDMTGPAGYPSNAEGWGRLLADNALYLSGDSRRLVVQDIRRNDPLALSTSVTNTHRVFARSSDEPLRVTLTWMDPPVAHNATAASVNNLNLVVVAPGGQEYKGNWFANGQSAEGGNADAINNVEQVLLPTPATGIYEIRIAAAFVNAAEGKQGYAIAATGDIVPDGVFFGRNIYTSTDTATITVYTDNATDDDVQVSITSNSGDAETVTLPRATPTSYQGTIGLNQGAPQQGSGTLDVSFDDSITATYTHPDRGPSSSTAAVDGVPPSIFFFASNGGTDTSVNVTVETTEPVTGTLSIGASPGEVLDSMPLVRIPDDANGYQADIDGLLPNTTYYVFFDLEDAAGNQTTDNNDGAYYIVRTAERQNLFFEDFESGLGQMTLGQQTGTEWTIRTDEYYESGNQAAFVADPPNIAEAYLLSPVISLPSDLEAITLSFWHTHEFESGGWDGGVLEIKVDGGTWEELESYTQTPPTGVLPSSYENPHSGKTAWVNGTLGKMAQVRADLSGFSGGTVQFQWIMAADNSVNGTGWYVDDISVDTFVRTEPSPTPTPTQTVAPTITPTTTPTISLTPTSTPTVTPTPIPTSTTTPLPATYHFSVDAEGWAFGNAVPFFDEITGTYNADTSSLEIVVSNTNSFGFWESPFIYTDIPEMPVRQDDLLYRATYEIGSNVAASLAPTLRVRTSSRDFQRSDVLVVTSIRDGAISPSLPPRLYTHYFEQAPDADALRLNFDVLSFDPSDATNAIVALDSVIVDAIEKSSLTGETVEMTRDFAGSGPLGFTPRNAEPALTAPGYFDGSAGLKIAGFDPDLPRQDPSFYPEVFFGYWGQESSTQMRADRLYRVRWLVSSDAEAGELANVPTFRLRLNDDSLRFSMLTNIDSVNPDANIPTVGDPKYYDLWFALPAQLDGSAWVFSFDYLYVTKLGAGEIQDDPNLVVALDWLEVTSFDLPAIE